MRDKMRILAATLLVALAPMASAQTSTTPGQNKGQALVAGKIASNFTNLAGGEDNSLALVNALRTGTDVTLVTVVPPPEGSPPGTLPTTTETTFTPPTKPMGWGNVKHALALAQAQLSAAGITDPTAAQLQTALMGGDLVVTNADGTTKTTTVKGILTMRADGMGWGNIAKAGGTKLGPVTSHVNMSGKPAATTTATSSGVTTAAGTGAITAKSRGVTTAAGTSAPGAGASSKGITTAGGASATHGSHGLVTASGASAGANPAGNAYGRGLVTGTGASATNVGAAMAHGNGGGGAGLVTAGGGAASSVANAGGNAGGNGKGQGNGKAKGG